MKTLGGERHLQAETGLRSTNPADTFVSDQKSPKSWENRCPLFKLKKKIKSKTQTHITSMCCLFSFSQIILIYFSLSKKKAAITTLMPRENSATNRNSKDTRKDSWTVCSPNCSPSKGVINWSGNISSSLRDPHPPWTLLQDTGHSFCAGDLHIQVGMKIWWHFVK